MFFIDSKKGREGVVEVDKFEPAIVEKVLKFIYTGQVFELEACARELLDAADYFQLAALEVSSPLLSFRSLLLQNQCLASILSNLSVERVFEDFELAFAFEQFERLKSGIFAFAKRNVKAVIELPGWTDEYVQANPRIVREFVKALATDK